MLRIRKYLFQYKFSLLLALIIAFLSLMPGESIPKTRIFDFSFMDKLVHLGMYASFSFVGLWESRFPSPWLKRAFPLLFLFLGFSGIIEIIQGTLTDSRAAELADFAANATGIGLGCLAHFLLFRRFRIKA
ncbi:MAG: hypothetical protein R2751_03555 [Bacteroidales bacterium]